MKSFASTALACAALLPSAALAGNMSLTLDGIPGSIEILSFNVGAKNSGTFGSGGGGGAGKVQYGEFTFAATESAASPSQLRHVNDGKHIPGARLSILHPDTGKPHSEWVLSDVLVSAFGAGNGAPDAKAKQPNTFLLPATTFALSFAKVCYRVFAADGSVAREACWNIAENAPV